MGTRVYILNVLSSQRGLQAATPSRAHAPWVGCNLTKRNPYPALSTNFDFKSKILGRKPLNMVAVGGEFE